MTSTELLAILAGTAALIVTLGTQVVNIIAAAKVNKKLEEINIHVNSSAAAAAAKIDALQKNVEDLTALLAASEYRAVSLAKAVSVAKAIEAAK
jgi:hypothetical protein